MASFDPIDEHPMGWNVSSESFFPDGTVHFA
jgi:hypothetical protein